MGLGPSIKMTTLHHFHCPVTKRLLADEEIDFCGIIVDGVSENCDAKIRTARHTAEAIVEELHADGAIVAIDGWGNHHIDFVSVIEELGIRDIPAVGLSYLGQQGRLVCTNPYVTHVIDFNKTISGYETCMVGQNNLSDMEAYKAIGLLKWKMEKSQKLDKRQNQTGDIEKNMQKAGGMVSPIDSAGNAFFEKQIYSVQNAYFSSVIDTKIRSLQINQQLVTQILKQEPRLKNMTIQLIAPGQYDFFVNANLDFMPIACKTKGSLGNGVTKELGDLKVMLTGVEEVSGYQPANIGSSEGILRNQVEFGQAGTPQNTDWILHMDFLFQEGEGRTAEGIIAAHRAADRYLDTLRNLLRECPEEQLIKREYYRWDRKSGKKRIALVKIASGLGNMYDTSMFPQEPGGYLGSYLLRERENEPVIVTPLEILDGAMHSLI